MRPTPFLLLIYFQHLTVCLEEAYLNKQIAHITEENPLEDLYVHLNQGQMGGYYTHANFWQIFESLKGAFPDYITNKERVGKTYLKDNIESFKIGKNINQQNRQARSQVLFTALHHSREPTSLTVLLTIMIDQLRDLVNDVDASLYCQIDVVFIPIVNVDSYKQINSAYLNDKNWDEAKKVRKNRNPGDGKCSTYKYGVDLNRNYSYKWAFNNEGSSDNKCVTDYRGTAAFSEPETQAMKSFIESNRQIMSAMNFHAWGDLWIYPFNYTPDAKNTNLKRDFPKFYKVYNEFDKEAPHERQAKIGNAQSTIEYQANGEASDWMLDIHNIIAFSPEVGSDAKYSDHFYLQKNQIPIVVSKFYPTVKFFIGMHKTNLILKGTKKIKKIKLKISQKITKANIVRIIVFNKGLSTSENVNIGLTISANQSQANIFQMNFYKLNEELDDERLDHQNSRKMVIKKSGGQISGKLRGALERRKYLVFDVIYSGDLPQNSLFTIVVQNSGRVELDRLVGKLNKDRFE